MEREIGIKSVNKEYVLSELENIGFERSYIHHAVEKNTLKTFKVMNLRPQEASILKQSALALGFDAAVNRGVLDCSVKYSDALLSGSLVQFKKLCESLRLQPFKMKKVAALIEKSITSDLAQLSVRQTVFDWSKPYIMGILNVTPDSFSDGGKFFSIEDASAHFCELVKSGADIVDIGAESTRPGHCIVEPDEEIKRLIPVLKAIRELDTKTVISVDTRNVKTAQAALEEGADIINDVGFAGYNSEMIDFVNANNVPYIIMHNEKPSEPFIDDIYFSLLRQIEKINAPFIADIGIGFGKNAQQNYELISRIKEFKTLGVPLLVGHSRKSFLSKTFDLTPAELDEATLAVSAKLMIEGVNILRVHDVRAHRLMADVLEKV